ncbi:hypothetical protein E2C01_033903 [Portunus trituberculatus]|uniref:Uncharacterized protein n=1 Tax=Portunus trituberculatus TaxID=210409 RepID=A0A5B7F468_PORTR|nr:hypothetical protein [Portunus trituberculatus]
MTASQRSTYTMVAEALRRRFGSVFQAEVYKEQLKGRTRQQVAPEEMVTVLSRDAFVDTLEDQQDVRARSPTKAFCENCGWWGHRRAAFSQLKDIMMVGGKRKQAGSSGHCPAKSSQGPVCVKCCSDATALAVRVSGAVDGRLCPLVVDTGAAKTFVREEVVASQDFPVSDRQLCGVTGHCTTL